MMAEAVSKPKAAVGWERTGMESSSDESDAYVPGVNQRGNMRPKMRARRPRELKARIPVKQPVGEELPSTSSLSVQDLSQSLDERRLRPAAVRHTSVSLKDLCVEDKRRIANLIRELAKVGEEREKAREELAKERKQYEEQILQLVEQQEHILRERQEIENQLIEYQNLLAKCQVQQSSQLPFVASTQQQFPTPLPDTHDTMTSLYANVGSPAGNVQRPVTALIDRELAIQRQQEAFSAGAATGYPQPATDTAVSTASSHTQHDPHHHSSDAGDNLPPSSAQQMTSPKDLFAHLLQSGKTHDFLAARLQQQRQQNSGVVRSHGSKDEIINRFFASQGPERDTDQLTSPKRRQKSESERKLQQQRSSKRGVFLPPIMSSTQKSTEFGDLMSIDSSRQEYVPLMADDSPGSTAQNVRGNDVRDDDDDDDVREGQGRVVFSEGNNQELKMYSPHDSALGEGQHIQNYRKLTQAERKQQLLQQRAQLLEEQKRLKQILSEQEAMLREKQQVLRKRAGRRSSAEDFGAGGEGQDDDPLGLIPQRLAIDAALERQRAIVDSLENQNRHNSPHAGLPPTSNADTQQSNADKPEAKRGGRVDSKQEKNPVPKPRTEKKDGAGGGVGGKGGKGFAPHSNKLSDLARKLEYSQASDSEGSPEDEVEEESSDTNKAAEEEQDSDEKDDENGFRQVGRVDVGTSVSYRNIPRSSGSPPTTDADGQKLNGQAFFQTHPIPARRGQAPGEKTMSVLEIINSLPDDSPPRSHPRQEPGAFKSPSGHPPHLSPLLLEASPSELRHRSSRPLNRWESDDDDEEIVEEDVEDENDEEEDGSDDENDDDENGADVYDDEEDDKNAELEESQILEDIFFLK